jgi:hypothetical protein
LLQVPHPPGSPLFLLAARIAMMIPFAADQAVRAHALSATFSAIAIMFFYLVIVRVIQNHRGVPATVWDRVTVYGSAVIGALSLAFGTTYWDNSIEAEVYGASMFFLAGILWLVLRWRERMDVPGSEKYILLIAYMIGLSLGVHLLALLAIFPVLMIIYFRRYELTTNSFVAFGAITLIVFFVVYPGIVKYLPGMMDGDFKGRKSTLVAVVPWAIIATVCYISYWSYRSRKKMVFLASLSMLLILFGYTTYVSVLIRSNANTPMNENDPSNLARLTSYLGREQYGDVSQWPRRYSQEPHQQGIYTNYTSEWDFLFRYQLSHMCFRYIGWNYIGAAGDEQDAGVSWKDTLGIPFLLALYGLLHLFKRDWKMGTVFLVMFIVFGPVLALYQNQQEPQPRERDYFYVGAYLVMSLWIAVGLAGIIDYIRRYLKSERQMGLAAVAVVAVGVIAVPVRLLQVNWHEHDRSGNYVAWDYSYNILQTCEQDAILFTNGDNDTFPLWYLQDVEGVRRDVRIVNLSLVNTSWYIKQMKAKPYFPEAKAVPMSIPDNRIESISPIQWQTRDLDLPVTDEAITRFGVKDSTVLKDKRVRFTMRHTLQVGETRAIRIQDIMVRDIVFTNQWKRPIYFAVTVAPDSKIGLDDYLWFHGLAWRLEPRKVTREEVGLNRPILEANLFNEPESFSKTPQYGYKFRRIGDPAVFFDENTSRLMLNYRSAFMRLAMYFVNAEGDSTKAFAALERMENLIPRAKVPMGWELQSDLATFYYRLGRVDKFNELADEVEVQMRKMIEGGQVNVNSYWNPYRVLFDIYDIRKDYAKTLDLLKTLMVQYPDDPGLKRRVETVQRQLAEQQAGRTGAAGPDTGTAR